MPAPPGTVPGASAAAAAEAKARKRSRTLRTKFSPEQKQRMQALSERLGWRLQKRDEAVVDECCREMGVTKGAFKVWMGNNKHKRLCGYSARRSASVSATVAMAIQNNPSAAAAAAGAVYHPSYHGAVSAPATSAAAAVHLPSAHAVPAPTAPVHADFNSNDTAADYFRVQPSTASGGGGSPQLS